MNHDREIAYIGNLYRLPCYEPLPWNAVTCSLWRLSNQNLHKCEPVDSVWLWGVVQGPGCGTVLSPVDFNFKLPN